MTHWNSDPTPPIQTTIPKAPLPATCSPRRNVSKFQAKSKVADRVLDRLRENRGRMSGVSVRVLAKQVGASKSTVHNVVAGMIAAGALARIGGDLVVRT